MCLFSVSRYEASDSTDRVQKMLFQTFLEDKHIRILEMAYYTGYTCVHMLYFKVFMKLKNNRRRQNQCDVDILTNPRLQITDVTRLACRGTPLVHSWITARGFASSQNLTVRQSVFGLKSNVMYHSLVLESSIKYLYY